MASGTPLLTTKLPGMPKEYYPYVYLFEKETIDGYARILKEVLSIETEMLEDRGEKGKKFVMQNKNNVYQAKRVLEFICK